MITLKLDGGLGNQLFQYAFIKSLSNILGLPFRLDVSSFRQRRGGRSLMLNHLNIAPEIFYEGRSVSRHLTVLRLLRMFGVNRISGMFIENGIHYQPEIFKRPASFYYGYFQCFSYFNDIYHQLVREIRYDGAASNEYLRKIRSTESVAVHIRKGDYQADRKAAGMMAHISPEYYSGAAKHIARKLSIEPIFYLFSDDLQWTMKNILPSLEQVGQCVLIDNTSEPLSTLLDFECMKECRHQVIANSTYSWWAAYLNTYDKKQVVAPQVWYRRQQIDYDHFYPVGWTLLPNTFQ